MQGLLGGGGVRGEVWQVTGNRERSVHMEEEEENALLREIGVTGCNGDWMQKVCEHGEYMSLSFLWRVGGQV